MILSEFTQQNYTINRIYLVLIMQKKNKVYKTTEFGFTHVNSNERVEV